MNELNNGLSAITDHWIWLSAIAVLIVLLWVAAYTFYRSKPSEEVQEQTDGWIPTGRIDFSNPHATDYFILRAEDTRVSESIGGVEHREIRWRKATLDEAKAVVVSYHAQRNLTMTANLIVNSSRQRSRSDNEYYKDQVEKDENPQAAPA